MLIHSFIIKCLSAIHYASPAIDWREGTVFVLNDKFVNHVVEERKLIKIVKCIQVLSRKR